MPSSPDEFQRACDRAEVDPEHREALLKLLHGWAFRSEGGARIRELLEDYGHWRLFRLSREGDGAAARRFEAHWQASARAFLGRGFTREQIEEFAALFFERVYERANTFAWRTPFTVYLRTILLNIARDEVRRLRRTWAREERLDGEEGERVQRELPDRSASPEQAVLDAERRRILERAMRELKPVDRQLLLKVIVEGRSGAELARVLGIGPAALHQRLHRARKRLQSLVERELSGGGGTRVSRTGGQE